MKYLLLFALLAFLLPTDAADLKTKSGKIYKNYTIIGTCPEGLTILHSNGGGIVSLEEWPENRKEEISRHIARIQKKRKLAKNRPDLHTKSGMVYKNYKILSFQPSGLKISFWSGTKIINYSELPDSIQKQYADQIAKVKPKQQSLVLNETPKNESRAPIDLKLDNPNSKAARKDYKSKKKDKIADEETDEPPKKQSAKNKAKHKKSKK